jgi:hypothetical protein
VKVVYKPLGGVAPAGKAPPPSPVGRKGGVPFYFTPPFQGNSVKAPPVKDSFTSFTTSVLDSNQKAT